MTKKTGIAILSAIISFTACTKKNDVNRQLVEDHFKYMNRHNIDALKNQYADTAVLYSYVVPGQKRGPLGADEIYHFMFFATPNEQYRILDIMDNDTATVIQYDVRGFLSLNNLRSGYGYRGCMILKIKDGKIINEVNYSGANSPLDH